MTSADISVIFQGPIIRSSLTPSNGKTTQQCIAQVKALLPEAEIILSTWIHSGTDLPQADQIILNEDPGAWLRDDGVPSNVNRQIVSTSRGLQAATRPYALKIRTDSTLNDTGFIDQQQTVCARHSPHCIFSERILTLEKYTRHPARLPLLHHPGDLFQFGPTPDLRLLWNIPLSQSDDTIGWSLLPSRPKLRPFWDSRLFHRYSDEQYIWTSCVRNFYPLRPLDYLWQCLWSEIPFAESLLANNFRVVSEEQAGALLPTRFREHGWPHTCYTTDEWKSLMNLYSRNATQWPHLLRATGIFISSKLVLLRTAFHLLRARLQSPL